MLLISRLLMTTWPLSLLLNQYHSRIFERVSTSVCQNRHVRLFVVHGSCLGNVVRKLTWQSVFPAPAAWLTRVTLRLSDNSDHTWVSYLLQTPRSYNDNVPVVACTGTNGHTNHRSDEGREGWWLGDTFLVCIMLRVDNVSIMTQSPAIVRGWDSCK